MATINSSSIRRKAEARIKTPEMQREIQSKVRGMMLGTSNRNVSIHTPKDAANKFMIVLRDSIESSGLSQNAIDAISDLRHTEPFELSDGRFGIYVYFAGDTSRPSLNEDLYGEIHSLVALFNNGVDHRMHAVRGEWHGKETWSRTVIPGTYFIQQAVQDFKGNYATEYNVIEIKVDHELPL